MEIIKRDYKLIKNYYFADESESLIVELLFVVENKTTLNYSSDETRVQYEVIKGDFRERLVSSFEDEFVNKLREIRTHREEYKLSKEIRDQILKHESLFMVKPDLYQSNDN